MRKSGGLRSSATGRRPADRLTPPGRESAPLGLVDRRVHIGGDTLGPEFDSRREFDVQVRARLDPGFAPENGEVEDVASPLPVAGELETLSNVILTPHVAGITAESQLRINEILAANITLVLNGSPATHAVGKVK